jgi:hypothetical protein
VFGIAAIQGAEVSSRRGRITCNRRIPLSIFSFAFILVFEGIGCTNAYEHEIRQSVQNVLTLKRSSFTIWQLKSVDASVMMGYILLTPQNEVIVIDGGVPSERNYLKYFLAVLGNRVSAWYLTHPHIDHVGALANLLSEKTDIKIDHIYGSFPSRDWVAALPADEDESATLQMYDLFAQSNTEITPVALGQVDVYGELKVEILGVKNPEIIPNGVNNSSMLLRVSDGYKSIMFLGDMGAQEWTKVMSSPYRDRFSAVYVQVAHHGWTDGIDDLYRQIAPTYGLWPTTFGELNGASNYPAEATQSEQSLLTLLNQIGVKQNYFSFDQLYRID